MQNKSLRILLFFAMLFIACKKENTVISNADKFRVITEDGQFKCTKDGGFSVFNSGSGVLTKYDSYGLISWKKSVASEVAGLNNFGFNAYTNTTDNGFAILGTWEHALYDVEFELFLKLNSDGDVQHREVADSIFHSGYNIYQDFIQSNQGNYFGLYENYSPGYSGLSTYNASGKAEIWQCAQSDYTWYQQSKMKPCADGGFYLLGIEFGVDLYRLTKEDSVGCYEWTTQVTMDGLGKLNHLYLTDLIPTSDGGCLVSGYTNTRLATYDFFLRKYNERGEVVFTKNFGTAYHDYCFSMLETRDGGVLMVGSSSSNPLSSNQTPDPTIDFNSSIYLLKLNNTYTIEWGRSIGTHIGSAGILANEDDDGIVILAQQNSYGNLTIPQKMFIRIDKNGQY